MVRIFYFVLVLVILGVLSILWNYYMDKEFKKNKDGFNFFIKKNSLNIRKEDLRAIPILEDKVYEINFLDAVENISISDMSKIKVNN